MITSPPRIRWQVAQNNREIDLSIEIGSNAVINLTLSRGELEDMLEAISAALDDDVDSTGGH